MTAEEAVAGLVSAGERLSRAGLSPGSTGNLSVRQGDRIYCTPTGADLGALDPDALAVLDLAGAPVSGPRATKEVPLHVAAYEADATTTAVIHLHSTYATAVSCLSGLDPEDAIVPYTPYLSMRAGRVALAPYVAPGAAELGSVAGALLNRGHRCLLLANHGSVIAGTSMEAAMTIAFELEESARLQLLLDGRGTTRIGDADRSRLLGT